MATALNVFGNTTASTTLTTANTLATTTGGTGASIATRIGTNTGFVEIRSQGTTTATFFGSIQTPTGNGWLLDATTLEAQDIVAGTWAPSFRHSISTSTATADITIRAYKRSSAGAYTAIGSWTLTGQTFSATQAVYTPASSSLGITSFGVGDKLYIDEWWNITVATASSTANAQSWQSSTAGLGVLHDAEVDTPGFNPTPVSLSVTMAGVGTLSGTLTCVTALACVIAGVGTLSPALTCVTALACTLAGVGTLSIRPTSQFLNATWITRDLTVSWVTRDGNALWKARQ